MILLLADEHFPHSIVDATRAVDSEDHFLTVQDVDLFEVHDREILAWAAQERRILLTHDVRTMPMYAAERLREGQAMPGLVLVPQSLPIGRAIDDLLLMAQCSQESDYEGIILRLPL